MMSIQFENRWHVVKQALAQARTGVVTVVLAGALAFGVVGCAQAVDTPSESGTSASASAQSASAESASAEAASQASRVSVANSAIDESAYDLDYTDRDLDPSYDAESVVSIVLSTSKAHASDDSVEIDGQTITITQEGVYVLSGTFEGQIVVSAPEDAKVQLVLDGVTIFNKSGSAIYVEQADKCFITLADGTVNTVSDGAGYTFATGEDEPDAAIFSTCDLTLQGLGTLKVDGVYNDGIKTKDDLVITGGTYEVSAAGDGLVGKDSVKIANGSITVDAGNDGIKSSKDDDSSKGFISVDGGTIDVTAGDKGINCVTYLRVADAAQLKVTAGDDALHSDGDVRIDGGSLSLDAGDDGVHAEYELEVNGGVVDVVNCEEGLEGQTVTVNAGDVSIVANDDGINASSPENTAGVSVFGQAGGAQGGGFGGGMMAEADESCVVTINGGTVSVEAGGDGLDSNGFLYINGGVTFVSGPTDSGNGSLDYELGAEVTGGTLIAAGSSGMAVSFTEGTQAFALVQASGSAGDTVAVVDASGTELASFVAAKSFQCVVVTTPGMQDGQTYALLVNGNSTSFEASTSGNGFGMAGQVPGQMGGRDAQGGPGQQAQGGPGMGGQGRPGSGGRDGRMPGQSTTAA